MGVRESAVSVTATGAILGEPADAPRGRSGVGKSTLFSAKVDCCANKGDWRWNDRVAEARERAASWVLTC